MNTLKREQMNIVVVGHVDHGKSTVIGRLLVDTDSLPKGKLEQVKAQCVRTSKPFEYAFMLDALKDEQSQGITIDSARCFFKSKARDYIIIDAPGHIEFLKNMISGASRAEAALLTIDAKEGIQENSRRHGYMLSMLGVKQIAVCVNKMDLVNYNEDIFKNICDEYEKFLLNINIKPMTFIPISAREGDNITSLSKNTPWYKGNTILGAVDSFEKEKSDEDKPFRFPVQDIYKFTNMEDDRRIVAGRVESGSIKDGDEVVFLPSNKSSRISSIESFNTPQKEKAVCGESIGFTLEEQIYIKPGDIMCRKSDYLPKVGSLIRVNLFWMGNRPMIKSKKYSLKLSTAKVPVWLYCIDKILDASDLSTVSTKEQIDRHDVAECVLQTFKPIAMDLNNEIMATGRFVIVDDYEIAGGGIISESIGTDNKLLKEHIEARGKNWERSTITPGMRSGRHNHKSTLVVISGDANIGKRKIAKSLEEVLFVKGKFVYYLGISNALLGIDSDMAKKSERDEYLRRLGEMAYLFTDAGIILITTISDIDDYELEMLVELNKPNDTYVVNIGENRFTKSKVDLNLPSDLDTYGSVSKITEFLKTSNVLIEYYL